MREGKLQISTSAGAHEGNRIVHLRGPLTIATLFEFQELVRRDDSAALILDFSAVPYVDSAGLGSVLGAYVSRQKNGRRLTLVGVSERVRSLFQLTRVDQFFTFHCSIQDAEAHIEYSTAATERQPG